MKYVNAIIRPYLERFENVIKGKELYFWGSGEICANMLLDFKYKSYLKGIFDNDKKKHGTTLGGMVILNPAKLEDLDFDHTVIIITSSYFDEIETQLKTIGVRHIFHYIIGELCYAKKARYGFSGNYLTWEEAEKLCCGYHAENILEMVKKSIEKVIQGEAVFEQDSVLFYEEKYNFYLLTALLHVAAVEKRLAVIDFGGSLGSTFFQNKKLLHNIKDMTWNIIEQEHFVDYGKNHIMGPVTNNLKFFYDLEECKDENANCVLLSGSLQFLNPPYDYLNKIVNQHIKYIIIDLTPFFQYKDRIVVQKVHPMIYDASYPAWIFNEDKFLDFMGDKYELILKWECESGLPIEDNEITYLNYKGMLFQLK